MTSQASVLNELIEITRDGEHFYQHAETAVHDPRLKAIFHDMALAKTQIIQALALKVAENQEHPAEGGTVSGALRQLYADIWARLASDGDATYVAQLESAEDRLLHAFEEALEEADPELRTVLSAELPNVRASHDRMSELKRTLN
ncbi:PA2169 family four-helix-bundle protein [Pseudomonas sp. PDM16]|uniref:PA2169 family four-helix-bundle protein n=1 Tax=Pseudomonas sp. PDM16 TaxID=2769292 RepID=UPI00177E8F73|nr:PA2169 family four-helix-bundle protein [Pseudomonas sp. PDM16]MBD9413577.1 PA2169 family four-helix-bundle protein [Pseudomonas sp. PDM16]